MGLRDTDVSNQRSDFIFHTKLKQKKNRLKTVIMRIDTVRFAVERKLQYFLILNLTLSIL